MRLVTILVLAIFIAAAGYTAFSALTFEPDPIPPLTFAEPDDEQLKQLGIILHGEEPVQLTPLQSVQADEAFKKVSQAVTLYQSYSTNAAPPVNTTLSILTGAIGAGKLPAYFLNDQREFEMLRFNIKSIVEVQSDQASAKCMPGIKEPTSILIGDESDNALFCDLDEKAGSSDQIFLGGPGDDTITDVAGNRVVNAGSGNDIIRLGAGRSIIVLEEGWGKDSVTIDCSNAKVEKSQIPANFAVPWTAPFTNFIVLSPRIQANNVIWQGNVLTNLATGDELSVNENCFNVVSANR